MHIKAIYGIFDTQEQQWVGYGTKVAWVSVGAAKNAWNLHDKTRPTHKEYSWKREGTFDNQSQFVIKNLLENFKE